MAPETIGDRLRRLREAQRLRLREVGQAAGVSAQAVSNYEHGLSIPATERISKLAKLFDVSESYLLTGSTSEPHVNHMEPASSGGRVVPVYAAGDIVSGLLSKPLGQVTTHFSCGVRSYVVGVWDDSNAPEFAPGDQIVLDPDLMPTPGDMVLAAVSNLPVFGRLERRGQVEVIVHLNSMWGEYALDAPTAKTLAVMTEHARPRRR